MRKTKRKTKKKAAKKGPALRSAKRPARKPARKTRVAKKAAKSASAKKRRAVGKVTHFYNEIGVAIVRFNRKVAVGVRLAFKGATTDFEAVIASMQYDHKPISAAPKGKQVGVKVKKRVREGDAVYIAE